MKKLALALISALSFAAHAGVVIDNSVTGPIVNDFEAYNPFTDASLPGLVFETGAIYGERFDGQTLSVVGGSDVLTGSPYAGLSLLPNADNLSNIGFVGYGGGVVIEGQVNGQFGEGALSVLLDFASDLFAFDVVGADGGQFLAQFFDLNGNIIGSISQLAADGHFGFRATGGDLIWGVSITNTDPGGIGYDNVSFTDTPSASVPEPATVALLGLSLLGLGAARRRSMK